MYRESISGLETRMYVINMDQLQSRHNVTEMPCHPNKTHNRLLCSTMRLYNNKSCTIATVLDATKNTEDPRSKWVSPVAKRTGSRLLFHSPPPRRGPMKECPKLPQNDTASTATSESPDYIHPLCSSESFHFDIDVVKKSSSNDFGLHSYNESLSKTSSSTLTSRFPIEDGRCNLILRDDDDESSSFMSDQDTWKPGTFPAPCQVSYSPVVLWPSPTKTPSETQHNLNVRDRSLVNGEQIALFPTSRCGEEDDVYIDQSSWETFSGRSTRQLFLKHIRSQGREGHEQLVIGEPKYLSSVEGTGSVLRRPEVFQSDVIDVPTKDGPKVVSYGHPRESSISLHVHRPAQKARHNREVPTLLGHILEERYQQARSANAKRAPKNKRKSLPLSKRDFAKLIDEKGFPLGSDAVVFLMTAKDAEARTPKALFVRSHAGHWSEST